MASNLKQSTTKRSTKRSQTGGDGMNQSAKKSARSASITAGQLPQTAPTQSAAPSLSPCVFEDVGYQKFKTSKSDGRIVLSRFGFSYQVPPTTDEDGNNIDGRRLRVRWSSMSAPPKINNTAGGKHLLKIHVGGTPHVFQMKDRADLERAKTEIISRYKSNLKDEEEKAKTNDDDENEPTERGPLDTSSKNSRSRVNDGTERSHGVRLGDSTNGSNAAAPNGGSFNELHTSVRRKNEEGSSSIYADVGHAGQYGGHIVLSESAFSYYSPHGNHSQDVHLEWTSIYKYKINSASEKFPMLRIVSFDQVSYLFRMKDRMDLEKIKKDIRERRHGDVTDSNEPGQDQRRLSANSFTNLTARRSGASLRQSHGANRKQHVSVSSTLGSFGRLVGPAADMKELEYVSSIHQNAELLLRSDGTISSADIIPYLASRYGVTITPDQAVDIACNLCGAKPRNEFSAQRDACNESLRNPEQLLLQEEEEEEDEDEAEIYYFDLVQMCAVLMIPELLQIGDQHRALAAASQRDRGKSESPSFVDVDISTPVSFRAQDLDERGSIRLSESAVGVVQVVIDSLIDVFEAELKHSIRSGLPLNATSLRVILESCGDVDTANDPELVQQMLDVLGPTPVLTVNNFLRALTSDVQTYPTNDARKEDATVTKSTKLSLFYDVFSFNWDAHKKETDEEVIPKTFATATYIDYAADSYRSALHNTSVWCLFILTTLIYLNFFITMIQEETGGLLCPNTENFGCTMGNKIIGWIITAFFCGLYGLFFILPTSMGNVHGRTSLLLLTLFITAIFSYVPFATLIWYDKGIPHNVTLINDYAIVCPTWIDPNIAFSYYNSTEDETQWYLSLDDSCLTQVEWCENHPEVQGKYLDSAPDVLTYDEFEKCYNFFYQEVLPEFGLWTVTGGACDAQKGMRHFDNGDLGSGEDALW